MLNQESLYEKYPKFFRQKDLGIEKSCLAFRIETGPGWFTLIDRMCLAIKNRILNHEELTFEFAQIKEKLGALRVYWDGGDDYIAGIVSMAGHMSSKICEQCGNVGKIRDERWLRCECEQCREKRLSDTQDVSRYESLVNWVKNLWK